MQLTPEDVRWIVAPLKGSAFLKAAIEQSGARHCDQCQIPIEYGSLCRRCSRSDEVPR